MPGDNRLFDGLTTMFGMDGEMDPSILDPSIAAKAINRQFRGGKNRTRPAFVHKQFIFLNKDDEDIVKYGNLQGATYYRKTRAGRVDCLIASIAGIVFRFSLVNERFLVERIIGDGNAQVMHAWFCQAEDWLYIQNGIDKPIFWEGLIPSTARRSEFPAVQEMPIGTIMCYAFGRVFVSDAFDQVAASDIIYGNGFTTTSNTQNFTENTYWAEGGSFGMPTNLGHITGLTVTTAQRQGNVWGQGVVLVLGEDGAQAIDASVDRSNWKDAQIQSVTLRGVGCLAPGSVCNVNNQTVFTSDDGISVYQNLASEQNGSLSFAKFSQATNIWLDEQTKYLRRFNSTIYSNNRLLSTVSPWIQVPRDSSMGNHRYHRGMVCLDLDRTAERITGHPMAWDGLWTGIRPTALVNGRFDGVKRAFAFSFDADGQNRIYEIDESAANDEVDGKQKLAEWFFLTKRFDWSSSQGSNGFERKKIVGGELHVSEVSDRITLSADYRSDYRPDWHSLMANTLFGPQFSSYGFTAPRWKTFKFLTPSGKCISGESYPVSHGLEHQIMISGSGRVRINRMRVSMAPASNDPNIPIGDDPSKADNPEQQIGVDGKLENDYGYLIVPS